MEENKEVVGEVVEDESTTTSEKEKKFNTCATLGLVFGILGLVSDSTFSIAGLILSIIGKKSKDGAGKAKAGLIMSIISLGLTVLVFIIVMILLIVFGPTLIETIQNYFNELTDTTKQISMVVM